MDTQQMKQAMEMVSKMKKIQKELEKTPVNAESGKGEVKIVANGVQKIESIKIDPQFVRLDKIEDLEKNLLKTINKALEESQKLQADRMKEITGGMHIPGLF
ncbi:MAG: YbaB/EbfC family nucleoid-associated protein [Dehalococcoidales bacterium]|nr:YbaB/EbfC family nucleoid-associated protein [Dehalococcoidales bacterium]